jgi:hypothetical protein
MDNFRDGLTLKTDSPKVWFKKEAFNHLTHLTVKIGGEILLNLISDIEELLGKYFSTKMSKFVMKELLNSDLPSSGVFYKVSQKGDYPEFELVYVFENALMLYNFSRMKKIVNTIPLGKVSGITIVNAQLFTRLKIDTVERLIFNSRAGTKSKTRKNLEELHNNIQKFMVSGGQHA